MASPSERLAEVRAALLELEACVAKYRGVRVPRRAPTAASEVGGVASPAKDAPQAAAAKRLLTPPLQAVVAWWRRSTIGKPARGAAPK